MQESTSTRVNPITAAIFVTSAVFWFWIAKAVVLWVALRMTYGPDRVNREGLTVDRYLRNTIVISNGDQWDRSKTQLIGWAHIGGAFVLTFATAYGLDGLLGIARRRFHGPSAPVVGPPA